MGERDVEAGQAASSGGSSGPGSAIAAEDLHSDPADVAEAEVHLDPDVGEAVAKPGAPLPHPRMSGTPGVIEVVGDELSESEPISSTMLTKALGGWRGMIDSSVPTAVFVVAYLVTGHDLGLSVWSAIAAGALMALWRLVRRQSLQQVLGGFLGVGISAFVAAKTGNAADFYLPGIWTNVAYATGLLLSAIIGWPLIGLGVGAFVGDLTGWRSVPRLRKIYTFVTVMWAAVFAARLAVQVPLYWLNLVGVLGVVKIAMGLPLTALAAWYTYRLIRPELVLSRPPRDAA